MFIDWPVWLNVISVVLTAIATIGIAIITWFEVGRDRELGQVPYIVPSLNLAPGETGSDWRVTNVGRGPAFNCRIVRRLPEAKNVEIHECDLFHVGDGQEAEHLHVRPVPGSTRSGVLDQMFGDEPNQGEAIACVCEDTLGNRYRFHFIDHGQSVAHSFDVRRRKERGPAPSWASWY